MLFDLVNCEMFTVAGLIQVAAAGSPQQSPRLALFVLDCNFWIELSRRFRMEIHSIGGQMARLCKVEF